MSVCLLITTNDRTPLLRNSLERLSTLTAPDEILVVDDGGTDDCEDVVRQASSAFEIPVRYIYTFNPGQTQCSHARNVGIKNTDCDIVITSEPEMLFDTDVIPQMLADSAERPRELVSAGVIRHCQDPNGSCPTCTCEGYVTTNWSATWIALYKREWLLAIGGWDEDFPDPWGWDDVDLNTRLRIRGIGQFIDHAIHATHQWHPHRGGSGQFRNEEHFKAKGFNGNEYPEHPSLFANVGREWGVPIPRP